MDAYWAKDIQELFRLERRQSFQKFAELLMAQSGGIFEATKFTRPCKVGRTTIANYLAVLEATFVAHVIRPYSWHSPDGDHLRSESLRFRHRVCLLPPWLAQTQARRSPIAVGASRPR